MRMKYGSVAGWLIAGMAALAPLAAGAAPAAPSVLPAAPLAASGTTVDVRTPGAFAGALREMGYDVGPVDEMGTGGKQYHVQIVLNGLKVQAFLSGCTNGDGCALVALVAGFGKVPAKPEWLATVNAKSAFAKVVLNDAGNLIVSYGFFPQGMTRAALRLTLDTYLQGAAIVARDAVAAGLLAAPPAPAPAVSPAPAKAAAKPK